MNRSWIPEDIPALYGIRRNNEEGDMQTARELFLHELSDMLEAENKIVEVLAQQREESSNSALRDAFKTHLKQTQGQVSRLQRSFELLDEEKGETVCAGIKGLREEHDRMKEEYPSKDILDLFNLAAAIKVERYEISSYEALIRLATMLGLPDILKLLKQNLKEEEQTLKKLTTLTAKVKPEILDLEDEESEMDESIRESKTHLVKKSGSRKKRAA